MQEQKSIGVLRREDDEMPKGRRAVLKWSE